MVRTILEVNKVRRFNGLGVVSTVEMAMAESGLTRSEAVAIINTFESNGVDIINYAYYVDNMVSLNDKIAIENILDEAFLVAGINKTAKELHMRLKDFESLIMDL